jgi:hypothetical protein
MEGKPRVARDAGAIAQATFVAGGRRWIHAGPDKQVLTAGPSKVESLHEPSRDFHQSFAPHQRVAQMFRTAVRAGEGDGEGSLLEVVPACRGLQRPTLALTRGIPRCVAVSL